MTHISTTLTGETWLLSFTENVENYLQLMLGLSRKSSNVLCFLLLLDAEVSIPSPSIQLPQQKPMEVPLAMNNPLPFPSNMMAPIGRPTTVPHDTDEDEGLKHFEQVISRRLTRSSVSGV